MNRTWIVLVLMVWTCACAWPGRLLRGYAEGRPAGLDAAVGSANQAGAGPAAVGLAHFVYDDWGSLNTDGLDRHTVPWKLAATAMVMRAHEDRGLPLDRATLDLLLREFGFVTPERVVNWRGGPSPTFTRPIGLVGGTMSRGFPRVELEGANVGCAACHAGVLYDGEGAPTRDVWIGLPNTSLNLQAYAVAIFAGLEYVQTHEAALRGALYTIFPDVTEAEWSTLEKHGLPTVRDYFENEWSDRSMPFPFVNGSAGLTNGVGSIKNLFGLVDDGSEGTEVGFTSIPDLGGTHLRSSLLYDGTYAAAGRTRFAPVDAHDVSPEDLDALADIVTFFVVPTLGVQPDRARRGYEGVRQFMEFLVETRSPAFPGRVDRAAATRGRRIYDRACSSCHGSYSPGIHDVQLQSFPNRLVPQDSMGTDPYRWEVVSSEFIERVGETSYGRYLSVERTGGYVAPPLTSLWATAPYLHNGSVPTLWHLMRPKTRPERFFVGGHRLDFTRVGIDGRLEGDGTYGYPASYDPWSEPYLHNTGEPGRSSAGHDVPFADLTEDEKAALLEFLKVL